MATEVLEYTPSFRWSRIQVRPQSRYEVVGSLSKLDTPTRIIEV